MKSGMKILVAYDGSKCANAALDEMQFAGLPRVGEAVIMSITEVWLPPPPGSSYEILEQASIVRVPFDLKRVYAKGSLAVKEAKALAERAAKSLSASFPGWKVRTEASYGSPAWELVQKADKWRPDLVVVGSHGRSALGRLFLGSISQRVLTESRCSVRVARGRARKTGTPVRIVIGIDGSEPANAALREVAGRRWPAHSEARVVIVDDPLEPTVVGDFMPSLVESVAVSNKIDRVELEKVAQAGAKLIKSRNLRASAVVEQGDPKRVLPAIAESWGADCIFVGATGFSNRLERFLLGSISSAVAARAHCSVEVVRAKSKRRSKSNGNGR